MRLLTHAPSVVASLFELIQGVLGDSVGFGSLRCVVVGSHRACSLRARRGGRCAGQVCCAQRCGDSTLGDLVLCPTPAAPGTAPPAAPCISMTSTPAWMAWGTITNPDQCRCGVMALAGSHCRSSSAARQLPLCTVNVHSPIQVPVVSLTQACSRPGQYPLRRRPPALTRSGFVVRREGCRGPEPSRG